MANDTFTPIVAGGTGSNAAVAGGTGSNAEETFNSTTLCYTLLVDGTCTVDQVVFGSIGGRASPAPPEPAPDP